MYGIPTLKSQPKLGIRGTSCSSKTTARHRIDGGGGGSGRARTPAGPPNCTGRCSTVHCSRRAGCAAAAPPSSAHSSAPQAHCPRTRREFLQRLRQQLQPSLRGAAYSILGRWMPRPSFARVLQSFVLHCPDTCRPVRPSDNGEKRPTSHTPAHSPPAEFPISECLLVAL